MRAKSHNMSKKKETLRARLVKEGDYVIWKITNKSDIPIYERWGYCVDPISYKVYENALAYQYNKDCKIIRDIHFKSIKSKKRNNKFIIMELSREQVRELRKYNIRVVEYEYMISYPCILK